MTNILPQFVQVGREFVSLHHIQRVKFYEAREHEDGFFPARPVTIEIVTLEGTLNATGQSALDLLYFFEDYSYPVVPIKKEATDAKDIHSA